MNIHEYQAKELLKSYDIPVPKGEVVYSDKAAARVAEEIGGQAWVVKAQVHAGGRGKAGGVKIATTLPQLREITDRMIGQRLVTFQTGPEGALVQRVLVERACRIERELYLGMVVDRASQRITVIASADGGVDVEEVARETPERIHKEVVDPATGLLDFQCRKLATAIGLGGRLSPVVKIMRALYKCFTDKDALLAEINPLVVT
ncbi:MAG TPA: ATP-grasp domain-containing protein, partial [Actinomycetota bacterium]